MIGFRVSPNEMKRAKEKAGIVALSKYLRALLVMWLNGEIEVKEEDIKRLLDNRG